MSRKHDLTPEQARAIAAYIRQVADLMGLAHWDVYLAAKPAPKDAWASVHPVDGRQVAPIYVCRGWWDRSLEDRRNDIVHELIHVIHRDQTDLIRLGLADSGYLPEKAYRLLFSGFRQATEVMVDHLASVIAPSMPLMSEVATTSGA